MRACDDCGDEVVRRIRCKYCGSLSCPYCHHHTHKFAAMMALSARIPNADKREKADATRT